MTDYFVMDISWALLHRNRFSQPRLVCWWGGVHRCNLKVEHKHCFCLWTLSLSRQRHLTVPDTVFHMEPRRANSTRSIFQSGVGFQPIGLRTCAIWKSSKLVSRSGAHCQPITLRTCGAWESVLIKLVGKASIYGQKELFGRRSSYLFDNQERRGHSPPSVGRVFLTVCSSERNRRHRIPDLLNCIDKPEARENPESTPRGNWQICPQWTGRESCFSKWKCRLVIRSCCCRNYRLCELRNSDICQSNVWTSHCTFKISKILFLTWTGFTVYRAYI